MQGRCKEMYRKANEKETTHTGREEKRREVTLRRSLNQKKVSWDPTEGYRHCR